MTRSADSTRSRLAGILGIVAGVLYQLRPLDQSDIWWHLATGRAIWKLHSIPRTDLFSWTSYGRPWINHEWLFQLIAYPFWVLGEAAGIIALKCLFVGIAMAFVWRRLARSEAPWVLRWISLIAVFWTARHAWMERADLVSIAAVSVLFWILDRARRQGITRSTYISTTLLFALWANLHGGFLLGLLVIGAAALGAMIEDQRWQRHWAQLVVVAALATVVNPFGLKLHASLVQAALELKGGFINEWRRTPWEPTHIFWIGFFAFWITAAFRKVKRETLDAYELLPAAIISYFAVSQIRNVPYFAVGVLPMLFRWLGSAAAKQNAAGFSPQAGAVLRPLATALALLFVVISSMHAKIAITRDLYPIGACEFLAANGLGERFYNDYPFGGYWIWRFAGRPGDFVDGRLHTVDGFLDLYQQTTSAQKSSPEGWNAYLERFKVVGALVAYPAPTLYPSVFHHFFPRQRWALVYWDDAAMVFLRRTEQNQKVIRQHEFPTIDPDASPAILAKEAELSPALGARVRQEAERNRRLHPESHRAAELLSALTSKPRTK